MSFTIHSKPHTHSLHPLARDVKVDFSRGIYLQSAVRGLGVLLGEDGIVEDNAYCGIGDVQAERVVILVNNCPRKHKTMTVS